VTRLLNHFLRGLVFLVPIAVTAYVCYKIFVTIDGFLGEWLGLTVPGAGFALTIALITMVGFAASNFITRGVLSYFEGMLQRLPIVRLVYASVKDFLNAFVGEKRRFDKPVMVELDATGHARALGFVTQESLGVLGAEGYVTVYMPFSYSIAGWVQVFPARAVTRLEVESPELMAFVMSGGVTGIPRVRPPR
jgi:uncharacterized membrane protein